ncbi:MAG: hypothetical protein WC976_06215 [Caldisericia bacterium]
MCEARTGTKRILIKYARNLVKTGFFNWERIANEIRAKGLDYDYYESFFAFGPRAYDWVNGNGNWKELLELIKSGKKTSQIIQLI